MEEDIKILERRVKDLRLMFALTNPELQAIENVLIELKGTKIDLNLAEKENENLINRVKELEEERNIYKEELEKIDKALNLEHDTVILYRCDIIESLKRGITQLKAVCDNSIPKSKIREKIEEWDKSIKWANADDRYYAIKILQELLEDK